MACRRVKRSLSAGHRGMVWIMSCNIKYQTDGMLPSFFCTAQIVPETVNPDNSDLSGMVICMESTG